MPATTTARQIADVNARIADAELQIFQLQKRVENLLAKGADTTAPAMEIIVLDETLAYLEACKAELEKVLNDSSDG